MRNYVRRWLACAAMALVFAFPMIVAGEGEAPAKPDPARLGLLYTGPVPEGLDLGPIEKVIDRIVTGTPEDGAAAAQELSRFGPLAALPLRNRLDREADAAAKERLQKLLDASCADSEDTAKRLYTYGQALASISAAGPLNWHDPAVLELRAQAKFFHRCFVHTMIGKKPLEYAQLKGGLFTPYQDLPAAGGIYAAAAAMYERLAGAAQDPAETTRLRTEAERCRTLSTKAAGDGEKAD